MVIKENRKKRKEEDAQLAKYEKEYPITFLALRSPEGRAFFDQINKQQLSRQIAAIQEMPCHFVQNLSFNSDGSLNNEINAVLEFLGASKRVGYAHGFRGVKANFFSSWGYFDAQRGINHSFVECDISKQSKEALVFLLQLS